MQVPRVSKITLNMGVGEAKTEAKALDSAIEELTRSPASAPRSPRAEVDRRLQDPRGHADRSARSRCAAPACTSSSTGSCSIALPRIRDFRGLSPRSFDGRGNYSIGIREQIIFPEINYDDREPIAGLDVAITTTRRHDEQAFALLRGLGLPFAAREEKARWQRSR
jgi:large subunit ribosomal protein L5